MYTENRDSWLDRRDFEARARYERSAAFHSGLASIARFFTPRPTKQ